MAQICVMSNLLCLGPRRGTRSSLALALALSLVRAAVRWIDHGYEYEGARLKER